MLIQRVKSALSGRSEFARNVAKISAGSVAKTAISLLALPIATRLYAADAFGSLQLFTSIVSVFVAIGAFKYEMAIVLPEDRDESNQLAVLCLAISVGFSGLILAGTMLFGEPMLAFFNASQLSSTSGLIPFGILIGLVFAVTRFTLTAGKHFGTLARSDVAQVGCTQVLSIGYGLVRPEFLGLVASRLIGTCLGIALALRAAPIRIASVSLSQLRRVAVKYRKFPMVNTVGVFANNLAIELPVFLLARFFGAEVVGFYMLTNRLLSQPMVLVGQAVSRVFLQSAAEAHNRGGSELRSLFHVTVRNLALLALLPAAVVIPFAPPVIEIVLGPEWREVGVFMQILMFSKYFEFIMTPVSTTFSIVNRQEIGVALMIASAIVRFAAMLAFTDSARDTMIALSVSAGFFSVIYVGAIYWVLARIPSNDRGSSRAPSSEAIG